MSVRPFIFTVAIAAIIVSAISCSSIRPYEKEYLLSPLMDEAVLSTLQPNYAKSAGASSERLASGGAGGGGTACPTCGG